MIRSLADLRVLLGGVLFAGLLSTPAGAEVERWSLLTDAPFAQFGPDQGLPGKFTTAIAEDKEGFLWVGTSTGLARWDGYRFNVYKATEGQPFSLPNNYVACLHADSAGRLWIGTAGGGLARYEPDTDRFTVFPLAAGGGQQQVWQIDDDGQGGLWIGTDGGIDHFDPATGTWTYYRHDEADPASLPDDRITSLMRDREGRLWVGTPVGLVRLDPGTDRFATIALPSAEGPAPEIWGLYQDRSGRIWVAPKNRGVFIIEPGTSDPRPVREGAGGGLEGQTVDTIAESANGQIWLGTLGHGIATVDRDGGAIRRIRHDPLRASSLLHDDVRTIYADREGFLWVGTLGGVSRYDSSQVSISTVFGETGRTDSLTDGDVWSVLAAADGRIWTGSREDGVDILDPRGTRVAALRPDPGHPAGGLPRDRVYALAQAAGGDVFIGTNRGLYRADSAGRKVARLVVDGAHPDMPVRSLLTAGGSLWIGTLWGGLWRVDPGNDAVTGHWGLESLTGLRVEAIAPAGDGRIWVGSSSGLALLDPRTGTAERMTSDPADPASLSASWVSSLLTDARGRLWVGTLSGGIDILDKRGADGRPRFKRLRGSDGLPSDGIAKLLADRTGRIWVSTNDGFAVIDPETLAIRALRRAEGGVIAFNWVNSGAATAEGEMLFGGAGGLTVAKPELLRFREFHPPLVVTDLRVGGKPVERGRAETGSGLAILPEANSLAVEFAALDYSQPETIRYAYRLGGYDRDWTETPWTRRLAAYTNLPPGDYRLEIKAADQNGAWSEKRLAFPVTVAAAWYQSWWFRACAGLAGILLVGLLVRSRTAYLRARQIALQKEVAERTADLVQANAKLLALATTDALTGCANRRHFVEQASQAIAQARRSGLALCLMVLDLDHFKQVNDSFGHPVGDEVLRQTAAICAAHMRTTDLLGRLGGEEFAILMTDTDSVGGRSLAERVRQAVAAERMSCEGHEIRITVSMGLAEREENETFDSLYARADAALYAAKIDGRDRITLALASAGTEVG